MKFLNILLILSSLILSASAFGDDDPSGECRQYFKKAKKQISSVQEDATLSSLFKKQEKSLIQKNHTQAKRYTSSINKRLDQSKKTLKSAIKTLSKAYSRCSGRSGKAQRLTEDAKLEMRQIAFKKSFNQRVLSNI